MPVLPMFRRLIAVLCLLTLPAMVVAQPSTAFVKRLADVEMLAASLGQAVSYMQAQNQAMSAQLNTQATTIAALQAALTQEAADRKTYADSAASTALAGAKTYSDTRLQPVSDKLQHVTRVGNNVYITGANLHVRNGLGGTTSRGTNSLGNLIVGYNESRGSAVNPDVRTGSHNIITGVGNNYSRAAAFMTGINNSSANDYASVLGGTGNFATGVYSVVVGGYNNQSSGSWSVILGGRDGVASGQLQHIP